MMKRTICLLLCLALLLSLAACAEQPSGADTQAQAYYEVFRQLYADDPALNGSKYIAVDLTKAQLADKAGLIELMDAFCTESGLTLLEGTFDDLQEQGLIKELHFEEGVLIIFDDITLTDNQLQTDGQKWRSGLGAIGADFTVEFNNGSWEITKVENEYVS